MAVFPLGNLISDIVTNVKAWYISGTSPHGDPATGNPLQVGGVYRVANPALSDGDAGSIRVNSKGEVLIEQTGSTAGKAPSATFTRPNDGNAYLALDVVGTSPATYMTFSNVLANSGGVFAVVSASLEIDVSAVPSGMSGFRLHLYSVAPTPIADNEPYNLPSADRVNYIDYVPINNPSDHGDTIFSSNPGVNITGKLAEGSTTLYGILQTIGAYTPTALTVKKITLVTAPL